MVERDQMMRPMNMTTDVRMQEVKPEEGGVEGQDNRERHGVSIGNVMIGGGGEERQRGKRQGRPTKMGEKIMKPRRKADPSAPPSASVSSKSPEMGLRTAATTPAGGQEGRQAGRHVGTKGVDVSDPQRERERRRKGEGWKEN